MSFGKNIFGLALAVFLLFSSLPARTEDSSYTGQKSEITTLPEEESKLSLGFEFDFASQYVWRGLALSDGPVLQPSMWFSFYGATLSVWGNFVLNDEPNQGQLNEVDITLGYHYQYKRFFVEPGLQFYLFPHQGVPATAEGSLALGVELGPVQLLTKQFFDFLAASGAYFGAVGVLYEKSLHPKLDLSTLLAFAWANGKFNEANFEVPDGAANLLVYGLEFTWYVREPLYLRPYLKISILLDDSLRQSVDNPNLVSGGLGIGVEL